jgi:TolB protein
MSVKSFVAFGALVLAAPLTAQEAVPPPSQAPQGLSGSVSDESEWQDLGIAIPAFATDRDTATPAGFTGPLGRQLGEVITADLRNNGLFKPTGPGSLPAIAYRDVTGPQFGIWSGRGADMLVHGFVRAGGDGRLTVGCYLYDVALGSELARQGYVVAPGDWRRAAHKCADMVYSRLSGESPFFDSKIAYIAETGPKDRRLKRLAIMDSDGANHRFITSGQATALTPRYSPDYKSIVYLSYLEGKPRIYVYDIGTGQQRLVAQSRNPTFAPRWSPDGRWILYSMAVGGNTDVYRVSSAGGGEPRRLTDSPGIDVGGSFSPDGTRIVFESDRSGSQQCYTMTPTARTRSGSASSAAAVQRRNGARAATRSPSPTPATSAST